MSVLYQDLPLTNFPENIDQFTTWINITATDGILVYQYQQALQAGNTTLANEILSQIPQATQKIIKAVDLNTLTQALLAIERFYKTDVEPYIQEKQESWLNTIQQFSYKGVWSSGTSYVANNFVTYTVSGLILMYLAISSPPIGTPPTNQTYWRSLTIQGQQGISGEGLAYRQQWVVSYIYTANDAVTYDSALWMALRTSQGKEPSSNPDDWRMIMNLNSITYPIQPTPPTEQDIGGLWFNTQNNPTKYYYLETLSYPATSNDIALGKQAYDEEGNLIVGTGAIIPIGGIIIWSGSASDIPSQWALCNGQNGTPDLTDKFVIGAGGTYNVDSSGGSDSISLTVDNLPSHSHGLSNVSINSAGTHSHTTAYDLDSDRGGENGKTITFVNGNSFGVPGVGYNANTSSAGAHVHTISGNISNTGNGQPYDYLPPYYALCYIMRIA